MATATCKHELIGSADGVMCRKCGKKMTAQEYADFILKPIKKATKKEGKK